MSHRAWSSSKAHGKSTEDSEALIQMGPVRDIYDSMRKLRKITEY